MMIVNKEKDIIYPMPEFEFQKTVVDQLARIETRLENIDTHLEKLNSKVATQEKEIFDRRMELVQHVSGCPIVHRVDALESINTSEQAKRETNTSWMNKILPVVYTFFGSMIALILSHADVILNFFRG